MKGRAGDSERAFRVALGGVHTKRNDHDLRSAGELDQTIDRLEPGAVAGAGIEREVEVGPRSPTGLRGKADVVGIPALSWIDMYRSIPNIGSVPEELLGFRCRDERRDRSPPPSCQPRL